MCLSCSYLRVKCWCAFILEALLEVGDFVTTTQLKRCLVWTGWFQMLARQFIHWKWTLVWYTGGSKKGELAGTGVYRRRAREEIIILMGWYATIIRVGVIGIEAAAKFARQVGGCRRVHIFFDSMTALTAWQNISKEYQLTLKCHNTLNSLAKEG